MVHLFCLYFVEHRSKMLNLEPSSIFFGSEGVTQLQQGGTDQIQRISIGAETDLSERFRCRP